MLSTGTPASGLEDRTGMEWEGEQYVLWAHDNTKSLIVLSQLVWRKGHKASLLFNLFSITNSSMCII